jgi:hypothetical protein
MDPLVRQTYEKANIAARQVQLSKCVGDAAAELRQTASLLFNAVRLVDLSLYRRRHES